MTMDGQMVMEAPISITLKSSKEYDSTWAVLRAQNVDGAVALCQEATEKALGTHIGNLERAFKAQFNVGSIIGGDVVESTATPQQQQQQTQPPAAQQPVQQQAWGQVPVQQAPQQGQWQAPVVQQQQVQQQGPGSTFAEQPPMVLGMPALPRDGVNKVTGRPWQAWGDPRPWDSIKHIKERTDDPNDPRLASGQVTFWKFR